MATDSAELDCRKDGELQAGQKTQRLSTPVFFPDEKKKIPSYSTRTKSRALTLTGPHMESELRKDLVLELTLRFMSASARPEHSKETNKQ